MSLSHLLSMSKNIAGTHSFLRLCNFYHRLGHSFAILLRRSGYCATPTRKDLIKWSWEQRAVLAPVTEGRHYVVTTILSYEGVSVCYILSVELPR
jgi:hypothetical protein